MSEYLRFEIELDAQRVAVIVSDNTLRAGFGSNGVPNDLNHLYTHHRSAIHAAATRRASSSPQRPVVLRAGDLDDQCAAERGRGHAGAESGHLTDRLAPSASPYTMPHSGKPTNLVQPAAASAPCEPAAKKARR